ncbi:MAG: type II toxin-antitoxin system VapC family toxin [Bryobacteraceae bacterium]|nr:type II toxin-antitoxin system VapC family toxin [Bryobacteraceae bacterium]
MTQAIVYLETSFISYLAARLSPNARVQQDQLTTHRWWQEQRPRFDLVVSSAVYNECARGDSSMAARRLAYVAAASLLDPHPSISTLGDSLIVPAGPLPSKAAVDAEHVSYAAFYGCDYLLTWNVRHIANPELRRTVDTIIRSQGYEPAVICTPALWFAGGPLA